MSTAAETRVYVPMTLPDLLAAAHCGTLCGPGTPAHAVTPVIREWYVTGDLEELEYAAMLEAAQTSLRRLALRDAGPWRRVVAAVDVPGRMVTHGGPFRSSITIGDVVSIDAVVSVHVDEPAAEGTVQRAVSALAAADAGDEDAQFLVGEAEAYDLLWYDVTEIPHLR